MPVIGSSQLSTLRPRRTIRLRLALLYGALFLVSGAALLGITYGLVAQSTLPGGGGIMITTTRMLPPDLTNLAFQAPASPQDKTQIREAVSGAVSQARSEDLRQLLIWSGIALVLMAGVSVALGWLVSGRALRPVREMTGKARRLSEVNLHERLAVIGPNDELKDLGDTFDGLLARLDTAFEAQKRFVANASHELRTPLTLQRTMIEVALADPDADAESLRRVCRRVLAAGDDQARLIEALLTLARSQRGLDEWEPVNLAGVVHDVLRERADDGVHIDFSLGGAWTSGDERLIGRLVTNLVENAVRHNVSGGWVSVFTGISDGRPTVRVTNSGQVIPPGRVASLFQPFSRLESRTGRDGHGLGLSIVSAIAAAHEATLTAVALPDGGLAVTVGFRPHPVHSTARRLDREPESTLTPVAPAGV